jgi:hypothetical protein
VAQVGVPRLHLAHNFQILLHLGELLALLVLDFFLVADRHEEVVFKRRDLQILQQNCLAVFFQLSH